MQHVVTGMPVCRYANPQSLGLLTLSVTPASRATNPHHRPIKIEDMFPCAALVYRAMHGKSANQSGWPKEYEHQAPILGDYVVQRLQVTMQTSHFQILIKSNQ